MVHSLIITFHISCFTMIRKTLKHELQFPLANSVSDTACSKEDRHEFLHGIRYVFTHPHLSLLLT